MKLFKRFYECNGIGRLECFAKYKYNTIKAKKTAYTEFKTEFIKRYPAAQNLIFLTSPNEGDWADGQISEDLWAVEQKKYVLTVNTMECHLPVGMPEQIRFNHPRCHTYLPREGYIDKRHHYVFSPIGYGDPIIGIVCSKESLQTSHIDANRILELVREFNRAVIDKVFDVFFTITLTIPKEKLSDLPENIEYNFRNSIFKSNYIDEGKAVVFKKVISNPEQYGVSELLSRFINEVQKESARTEIDTFSKEFSALLAKYEVDINFVCDDCSDTYGITGERMVVRNKDGIEFLSVPGWRIEH